MKTREIFPKLSLLAVILLVQPASGAPIQPLSLPVEPRQMILVVTKNWNSVPGRLQRFERESPSAVWKPILEPIPIVVGRNGLGWGDGLHPMPEPGPRKREGDGKAPAGVFLLRQAFGYATPAEMAALKIPYVQCTKTLECVDDTNSVNYNHVLERSTVKEPDWHSSEHMLLGNGQYRLGVVIEHDTNPPRPGDGSCVFMHIWLGPSTGTAGCTAMTESNIHTVVNWLDLEKNPVLVQLPESAYARLRGAWELPAMPKTKAR